MIKRYNTSRNPFLNSAMALNTARECVVRGCTEPRVQISKYCMNHRGLYAQFGSPTGRYHKPKEYDAERIAVTLLFKKNLDHQGIKYALRWFEKWLDDGVMRRGVPGQNHIVRMYDQGITPEELLIEATAIYVHAWNGHADTARSPLDWGRELTFFLGLNVLKMAKSEMVYRYQDGRVSRPMAIKTLAQKKVGLADRRLAGQYMRDALEKLFQNFAKTLKAQEQEKEESDRELASPFER